MSVSEKRNRVEPPTKSFWIIYGVIFLILTITLGIKVEALKKNRDYLERILIECKGDSVN